MEGGALGMETTTEQDPSKPSDWRAACLRRRAWAQSRDSVWQEPEPEPGPELQPGSCGPQGPQQAQREGGTPRPSEEPGRVPNKITSWLIECRTPLGASLDDQTASPSRGAVRNGCSFEDDLSLGAEANHLQSSSSKTESCYGLPVEQKRTQYKERGRSMNSTGSGKSSTVSSVSELLDLYEEDPEEILYNLGFGREEPDLASKVPSRFFSNSSGARGIDVKVLPLVYLGAQLQRMELENPNYALTSRFRQIEVLTTVANEFFQLYSQVSGQPVQRISSRDQGGGEGETSSSPLKRNNSALNAAKILKKTITKHNLLGGAAESPETHTHSTNHTHSEHTHVNGHTHSEHTHVNGHTHSEHTHTNGHTHTSPEQDGCSTDPDQQGESANQKALRKKDSRSLATVTEETNGDGETDRLTHDSPVQSSTGPAANGEHPPVSADLTAANQTTEERVQVVTEGEEKNLTSTPEKPPLILVPPQLAQLRSETTDSFDMEEVQSNEDEALTARTSRATDLSRTVSQQSDSSGFAEEPSTDSNSYLKLQESSDSCDSETTVTSHASHDVATPLALDHPAFDRLVSREEEEPDSAAEADGRCSSRGAEEHDGSSEQVTQYSVHQLPWNGPMRAQQDETQNQERIETEIRTGLEPEPEHTQNQSASQPESEHTQNQNQSATQPETEHTQNQNQSAPEPEPEPEHTQIQSASQPEPEHTQNQNQSTTDPDPHTEGECVQDETSQSVSSQAECVVLDGSGPVCPPSPSSLVHNALNRARQNQLSWPNGTLQTPDRGRGRFPLQRSSSLPSSLLSPSKVVSSVRIRFGRGAASCTPPKYSYKYCQEEGGGEEEDEEEEEGQTNCLSTLIINPASSHTNSQSPRPHTEAPTPLCPLPIPRHLMRSSYSLQSPSPPPDWLERSLGGHTQSWSTQSVPDLFSNQQQPGQLHQNTNTNQNQPSWNSGPIMFPYPSTAQYSNSSLNPNPCTPNPPPQYPNPNPNLNPSPNPCTPNPPQYPNPYPLHPYTSLPNLHYHNTSLPHHSSLGSLHQPTTPTIPQYCSFSNVHHLSLSNLHYTGTPIMHHQGYHHPQLPIGPYSHQSPYLTAPLGSPNASPYHGYHGYNQHPHPVFPPTHSLTQRPASAPGHTFLHGLAPPPALGSLPGLAPAHSPGQALLAGLAPTLAAGSNQGPSSTEMQLRKVLHDIRGTVQSLNQNSADTPDMFNDHRAALPSHQSVGELQQKRRSLNLFRSHMMDLELSIIRQQALVYTHLSPADRLEAEQLQTLRSAVREELQELEQQLEDRLIDLTQHTHRTGFHRDGSVDSLSTASALRAMEPVSDLLREQLFLQSELSYEGHAPSTGPSSRSSSPVRRGGEHKPGVYRASINITPAPPPRPNTHTEEEEDEEEEGGRDRGGGGGEELPEEGGARRGGAAGGRVENLQQLIREIRESVAQEVRQEIYSELLAAASPRRSPRQYPL
ncbi:protein ITPRID2 isoform X1 [Centroberyx gerrardi]